MNNNDNNLLNKYTIANYNNYHPTNNSNGKLLSLKSHKIDQVNKSETSHESSKILQNINLHDKLRKKTN